MLNKEQLVLLVSLVIAVVGTGFYFKELHQVPSQVKLVREQDFQPEGKLSETDVAELLQAPWRLSPLWQPSESLRDPWKEVGVWQVPDLEPVSPPRLEVPRHRLWPSPWTPEGEPVPSVKLLRKEKEKETSQKSR